MLASVLIRIHLNIYIGKDQELTTQYFCKTESVSQYNYDSAHSVEIVDYH
jgi:hypothetical protein